jgi:predicted NBD/HSP70 family sugar kinase
MAAAPDDQTNWEARAGLLAALSRGALAMPEDWPLWLARGLGTAIYAYDPETIVIAGELTDLFLAHRHDVAAHLRRLLVPGFPMPALVAARFGADGCAIGAASLPHARFLQLART